MDNFFIYEVKNYNFETENKTLDIFVSDIKTDAVLVVYLAGNSGLHM